MSKFLKNKILTIIRKLKTQGKNRLAKCIYDNWHKTAIDYSKELNKYKPVGPIEKTMLIAFEKELNRLKFNNNLKIKILDSLKRKRVIQTAPHLAITEIPRMLFINWLGSLATNDKDFYFVLMYSGIPLSNYCHPGRINYDNQSINLFPATRQDEMVYRSLIEQKLIDTVNNSTIIKNLSLKELERSKIGDSYTKCALLTCRSIEEDILNKKNLIYLDFNEIVTSYLLQVLKDTKHVLYKLFFDNEARTEFIKIFPEETLFYSPVENGKYKKMQKLSFCDNFIVGNGKKISLKDPRNLIYELKNKRLCPALLIGFLSLSFLNYFKCLGSFRQVEYLPIYQKKLGKLKFLRRAVLPDFSKVPTSNLTTGAFPENTNIYPIDILLGKKFSPNQDVLFGECIATIEKTILE